MASTSQIPSEWTIYQVKHPSTHKLFEILQQCKQIRSSLRKMEDTTATRMTMNETIHHFYCKNISYEGIQAREQFLLSIESEVAQYFAEFWTEQRKVSESFLEQFLRRFSKNISPNNPWIDQLKIFQQFAEKELKIGMEYQQILQQQPVDVENYQLIISKDINKRLNSLFRVIDRQQENLSQQKPSLNGLSIALLAAFLIGLILFGLSLASFRIYGNRKRLQELDYMWQGSGVYILYLWIDYGLFKYSSPRRLSKQGMKHHSYNATIFYQHKYKTVMLFTLSNIYLFLFLLFLNWSQNIYIGATINILLVTYQLLQYIVGSYNIGITQTLAFKLNCLHFDLLYLPFIDILSSISTLFAYPLHKNMRFIGSVSCIIPCIIFFVRLKIKENQYLIHKLFNGLTAILKRTIQISIIFPSLAPIMVIFVVDSRDYITYPISDLTIKTIFRVAIFFQPDFLLLTYRFLFNLFATTFQSISCCGCDESDQYQLFHKKICSKEYLFLIIYLLLILSSLSFPLVLPFSIHVEYLFNVHKYGYQGFVMFLFILRQYLYINEAYTLHNQILSVDRNTLNKLERDRKLKAAQDYLNSQRFKKFNRDLNQIQQKSRQEFLQQML